MLPSVMPSLLFVTFFPGNNATFGNNNYEAIRGVVILLQLKYDDVANSHPYSGWFILLDLWEQWE